MANKPLHDFVSTKSQHVSIVDLCWFIASYCSTTWLPGTPAQWNSYRLELCLTRSTGDGCTMNCDSVTVWWSICIHEYDIIIIWILHKYYMQNTKIITHHPIISNLNSLTSSNRCGLRTNRRSTPVPSAPCCMFWRQGEEIEKGWFHEMSNGSSHICKCNQILSNIPISYIDS